MFPQTNKLTKTSIISLFIILISTCASAYNSELQLASTGEPTKERIDPNRRADDDDWTPMYITRDIESMLATSGEPTKERIDPNRRADDDDWTPMYITHGIEGMLAASGEPTKERIDPNRRADDDWTPMYISKA